MLKTRRFLAIANGCGGSHAGRTCRLGRADDSFGTLPQGGSLVTNAGYSCWWQYGCKYCRVCRGGYYGGGCYTVKKYCKKRGYYY